MNRLEWMLPTSNREAYRRAGGRRRINAERSSPAFARRIKLPELIRDGHSNATIAKMFGVHRSQITRDMKSSLYLQIMDFRKLKRLYAKMGAKGTPPRGHEA